MKKLIFQTYTQRWKRKRKLKCEPKTYQTSKSWGKKDTNPNKRENLDNYNEYDCAGKTNASGRVCKVTTKVSKHPNNPHISLNVHIISISLERQGGNVRKEE